MEKENTYQCQRLKVILASRCCSLATEVHGHIIDLYRSWLPHLPRVTCRVLLPSELWKVYLHCCKATAATSERGSSCPVFIGFRKVYSFQDAEPCIHPVEKPTEWALSHLVCGNPRHCLFGSGENLLSGCKDEGDDT